MENLLDYLLTVILRNATNVQRIDGSTLAGLVSVDCGFAFTRSEIKMIRSRFAARWRYLSDMERKRIYECLKWMR